MRRIMFLGHYMAIVSLTAMMTNDARAGGCGTSYSRIYYPSYTPTYYPPPPQIIQAVFQPSYDVQIVFTTYNAGVALAKPVIQANPVAPVAAGVPPVAQTTAAVAEPGLCEKRAAALEKRLAELEAKLSGAIPAVPSVPRESAPEAARTARGATPLSGRAVLVSRCSKCHEASFASTAKKDDPSKMMGGGLVLLTKTADGWTYAELSPRQVNGVVRMLLSGKMPPAPDRMEAGEGETLLKYVLESEWKENPK